MLKKILLTVVVLLIAGGALTLYGTYKVADEYVKEQEPQLRQYVQMDEAAQDNYVLTHADELLKQAAVDATPEEKADINLLQALKDDPAVKKATTELGRAIMAAAILHSESIAKDLNAQLKAKFEHEKSRLSESLEKYSDALEAAEAKLKAAQ